LILRVIFCNIWEWDGEGAATKYKKQFLVWLPTIESVLKHWWRHLTSKIENELSPHRLRKKADDGEKDVDSMNEDEVMAAMREKFHQESQSSKL